MQVCVYSTYRRFLNKTCVRTHLPNLCVDVLIIARNLTQPNVRDERTRMQTETPARERGSLSVRKEMYPDSPTRDELVTEGHGELMSKYMLLDEIDVLLK
jgi:hypothetical protein